VVEELTQINVQIWADLSLCRFKGISFICAGDPGRQFPPVCESWAGCPVQEDLLEKSDMLYEMCGGNKFTLTENKRSDGKLFDFYTGLGQYADVQEALRVARQLFPASKKPADFTLTMSHGRRIIINKQRNLEEYLDRHRSGQQPDAAFLKAPVSSKRAGNRPQSMWVWPGLLLIGGGSHAKKGLFYKISEITDDHAGGLRVRFEAHSGADRHIDAALLVFDLCELPGANVEGAAAFGDPKPQLHDAPSLRGHFQGHFG
jgi:hypothetical protein